MRKGKWNTRGKGREVVFQHSPRSEIEEREGMTNEIFNRLYETTRFIKENTKSIVLIMNEYATRICRRPQWSQAGECKRRSPRRYLRHRYRAVSSSAQRGSR